MIIAYCEMKGNRLRVVWPDAGGAPTCEKHYIDATGQDSWQPYGRDATMCEVLAAILHKILTSDASDQPKLVGSPSSQRAVDVGWLEPS